LPTNRLVEFGDLFVECSRSLVEELDPLVD
jgi:hypothetical protein